MRWSESLFAPEQYEAESRVIVLVLREYFLRASDFFSPTYNDTTYGLVKGENVEQVGPPSPPASCSQRPGTPSDSATG